MVFSLKIILSDKQIGYRVLNDCKQTESQQKNTERKNLFNEWIVVNVEKETINFQYIRAYNKYNSLANCKNTTGLHVLQILCP